MRRCSSRTWRMPRWHPWTIQEIRGQSFYRGQIWNLCISCQNMYQHILVSHGFRKCYTFTYFQCISLKLLKAKTRVCSVCLSESNLDENGFKLFVSQIKYHKQNICDNIICFITIASRQNPLNSIQWGSIGTKLFCCVSMPTKHVMSKLFLFWKSITKKLIKLS